jgi:hypothetical protein
MTIFGEDNTLTESGGVVTRKMDFAADGRRFALLSQETTHLATYRQNWDGKQSVSGRNLPTGNELFAGRKRHIPEAEPPFVK